jgi:uncharacterized membrane protein YeaQ/YmgE (transglycosylase-associated protein family)
VCSQLFFCEGQQKNSVPVWSLKNSFFIDLSNCQHLIPYFTAKMNLLIYLALGGLAGWIGSRIMGVRSLGLVRSILLGLLGGLIGGWLFDLANVDIRYNLGGSLITATLGAIILLWLARVVKK